MAYDRIRIWTHDKNSEGAKALGRETGYKIIRHEGSKYVPRKNDLIINWGDSKNFPFDIRACHIANNPTVLAAITNKLTFFDLLSDSFRCPEWTTDTAEARGWTNDDEKTIVVARTVLTGHSGRGILLWSRNDETPFPRAPLYVKYVPKKEEYRIHFVNGKIIDTQQKRKRLDFEGEANFKIRNHANGFVYCRDDVEAPADVLAQAQLVIEHVGLDFGAIDIIYNERQQKAYVLEVNTAPGMEGQTVKNYTNAFKEAFA